MDLYRVAIVVLRIEGLVLLITVIFNLGYLHHYVSDLLIDPFDPYSRKRVVESWMFIGRNAFQAICAFVFVKFPQPIAALVVTGLRDPHDTSKVNQSGEGSP